MSWPETRPTRGLDRFGFVKRPVNAMTRSNPVDPGGSTRDLGNPGENRPRPGVFVFKNVGFETH